MKGLFHHKEKNVQQPHGVPESVTTTTTTTVEAKEPLLVGKETQRETFRTAETSREEILLPERMERPAVIHEKIKREEVEEIQPVIHRELDKTEIKLITQPLLEKEIKPVQFHESILPAEQRSPILPPSTEIPREQFQNMTEFEGVERKVVEKAPIIVETIKKHIIEEVQPIIYKEIHEPHVIKITKPIYERVVEAPVVFRELLPMREYRFEDRREELRPVKREEFRWKEEFPREELRKEEFRKQPYYREGWRDRDYEFEQDLARLKEMRLGKGKEEVVTTTTTSAASGATSYAAPSSTTAL